MNYVNQMELYQNAYRIAFVVAALALVLAVILFFVFDIRTIFLIKTGLAKRKTVQEMGERNARTGKLREDTVDKTGARTKPSTTKKAKVGTVETLDEIPNARENAYNPATDASKVPDFSGFVPWSGDAKMSLFSKGKNSGSGYFTENAAVKGGGGKKNTVFRFQITQKTIITHTDEIIGI